MLTRVIELGQHETLAQRLGIEITIQETCARIGEMERFYASDEAFHALIAEAAGFAHIQGEIDRAKIHMDRFRHLMVNGVDDMAVVLDQHKSIALAVSSGDFAGSVEALQFHLRRVLKLTEAAKEKFPEYFGNGQKKEQLDKGES